MATILSTDHVSDGFDVRAILTDGSTHTFHFPNLPADLQSAVDTIEGVFLMPQTLEAARASAWAGLATWYERKLAAGVDAGGLRLKATTYDQTRLAALATGVNTALIVSAIQLTDPLPSPVWDVNGVGHTMTVQEFVAAVLAYMAGVGAIEQTYAAFASEISAADTVAELAEIEATLKV